MSTNPNTRDDPWLAFRGGLFDRIEKRRDIASTFSYEQVYLFIQRCKTAFDSPGTDKAERALNATTNEGSFRLVVDSLSSFLAMFPTAGSPIDPRRQRNDVIQADPANGGAAGDAQRPAEAERRRPSESSTHRGSASSTHSPPTRTATVDEPRTRTSQYSADARDSSGRPF